VDKGCFWFFPFGLSPTPSMGGGVFPLFFFHLLGGFGVALFLCLWGERSFRQTGGKYPFPWFDFEIIPLATPTYLGGRCFPFRAIGGFLLVVCLTLGRFFLLVKFQPKQYPRFFLGRGDIFSFSPPNRIGKNKFRGEIIFFPPSLVFFFGHNKHPNFFGHLVPRVQGFFFFIPLFPPPRKFLSPP